KKWLEHPAAGGRVVDSNPPWPTFLLKKVVRASRRRREGGGIKSTLTLLNKKWLEHPAAGGRVIDSNPL
ncbi:MAG TPA: hypothetical protein PK605_04920, partial [Ignavibacteria bacterium]|nr:hypothetical protein [Ignavibacteria bacterium]